MISSNKVINERARAALKGQWNKSALLTLLVTIFSIILSVVLDGSHLGLPKTFNAPISVLLFIILEFINIGYNFVFYNVSEGKKCNYNDITIAKKKLWRNFMTVLILNLVTSAYFLAILYLSICIAPSKIEFTPSLFIAAGFFAVAIAVPFYFFFPTYYFLYFKMALDETSSPTEIIKQTYRSVSKRNKQFFMLMLRFTGWCLLCIVTLGIAFMWVAPYMCTSFAILYKETQQAYEPNINEAVVVA